MVYAGNSKSHFRVKTCQIGQSERHCLSFSLILWNAVVRTAGNCRSGGLRRIGFARLALRATIRVQGGAPERARPRLSDRPRRAAGAEAGPRPPGHGHVAAIERREPAFRSAPKGAGDAVRCNGERGRRHALAAPLPSAANAPPLPVHSTVPAHDGSTCPRFP